MKKRMISLLLVIMMMLSVVSPVMASNTYQNNNEDSGEEIGEVEVRYRGPAGEKITDKDGKEYQNIILKGNIGEMYVTQGLDPTYIANSMENNENGGYRIFRVEGETIGTFSKEKKIVTYYYNKINYSDVAKQGTIFIRYIDTEGNKIDGIEMLSYDTGAKYSFYPKEIPGWKPVDDGLIEGNYEAEDNEKTIDIEYEKDFSQLEANKSGIFVRYSIKDFPNWLPENYRETWESELIVGNPGEEVKLPIGVPRTRYGVEQKVITTDWDGKFPAAGTFKIVDLEYTYSNTGGGAEFKIYFMDYQKFMENEPPSVSFDLDDIDALNAHEAFLYRNDSANYNSASSVYIYGEYQEFSPKLNRNLEEIERKYGYDYKSNEGKVYNFKEVYKKGAPATGVYSAVFDENGEGTANNLIFLYDRVFTVIYKDRGDTTGTLPVDENSPYYRDGEATIKGKESLELKDNTGTFAGWSLKEYETNKDDLYKENSKITFDQAFIDSLDSVDGLNSPEGVTLYPQWTHSVTYDKGEGEVTGEVPKDGEKYLTNSEVTISGQGSLEREGYEFAGWAGSDGSNYKPGDTITEIKSDTTLTAQWKKVDECTLGYNGNGHTSGDVPESVTVPAGDEVTVADPGNMKKENNTFINWNTEQDGSGDSYNPGDKITLGTKPAEAVEDTENIQDENGDLNSGVEGKPNDLGEIPNEPAVGDSEVEAETKDVETTQNIEITPKVEVIDNNQGEVKKTPETDLDGKVEEEKSETTPEETGKVEAEIKDTETNPEEGSKECNMILYAQWKEDAKYKVTYDGNSADIGNPPVDNNEYFAGKDVKVKGSNTLEKDGYKFLGWSIDKNASTPEYKQDDTFKITADTTLYAIWEKDSEDSGTGWTWSGGSSTTSKESPKTEEVLTHMAYLNGYPDNTIRPQGSITRAEVATIFARLKVGETNIPSAKANYGDVNSSDWYAKYIAFVTDNKIMEGYEDGSFKPNDKITRAEFTAVVARYNSLADMTSTFEDVIGHWAAGYIGSVTNKGWINGYPDGTFKPEKDISREEVATMVNKMLDRKVDKDGLNNLGIKNFKDLDNSSWSYFDIVEASNSHKSVRRTLGDIMENWRELL